MWRERAYSAELEREVIVDELEYEREAEIYADEDFATGTGDDLATRPMTSISTMPAPTSATLTSYPPDLRAMLSLVGIVRRRFSQPMAAVALDMRRSRDLALAPRCYQVAQELAAGARDVGLVER